MADCIYFSMGEYRAEFPTDRAYARNHMWGKPSGDDSLRFGFSAYAVRLLQDVYFLEWIVPAGACVAEKQEIGQIESQKAEASLYAPGAGELAGFNETLMGDPSAINVDKYGTGWLFEMSGCSCDLLTPDDYLAHLAAVWEVTQHTIKGQMNKS
jgi:glycine cleavage system H protein